MIVGNRFDTIGYDIVAEAIVVNGGGPPEYDQFIVLNNNSTHYILAHRERHFSIAVFDRSFYYGPAVGPDAEKRAYCDALIAMVTEAMRY